MAADQQLLCSVLYNYCFCQRSLVTLSAAYCTLKLIDFLGDYSIFRCLRHSLV